MSGRGVGKKDVAKAEKTNDRRSSKVVALIKTIGNESANLHTLPSLIFVVCKSKVWETGYYSELLNRDVPPMTFEKFVSEPVPVGGLGTTVDRLKTYCRDDIKALAAITEATKRNPGGQPGNKNQSGEATNNDNVMIRSMEQGNSKSYALRKLEKDAPRLLERVLNNELSCNAAMIEAGFRKKKTPFDTAKTAWQKMTSREQKRFLKWVEKEESTT